jgi:hypothetical protein
VLSEKKILNETKNHNPPLQVKWSVPKETLLRNYYFIFTENKHLVFNTVIFYAKQFKKSLAKKMSYSNKENSKLLFFEEVTLINKCDDMLAFNQNRYTIFVRINKLFCICTQIHCLQNNINIEGHKDLVKGIIS